MVKLRINNKEIIAEPGTSVMKAALDNGIFIPHFCYHPALSISGNCRICVVSVKNMPKPVTSCTTAVAEGMEVETENKDIAAIRKSVLEFFLINHPIDCPVCDQAGECTLQDFTYLYGSDHSRFSEEKRTWHTKDVGPLVKLWANRCVLCARCVRFLNEITKTGELGIMNRGDRNVIDTFPGMPVDNPLSGNIVDICPVGALISKDFLYQARVWFMDFKQSVCPMCATGCNITAGVYQGKIKRFAPTKNLKVNQYWMCDYGRLSYKFVHSDNRLTAFLTRSQAGSVTKTTLQESVNILKNSLSGDTAVLASAYMDNEGLTALKTVTDKYGIKNIGCLLKPDGKAQAFGGGFKISHDNNPNRKGFENVFGKAVLDNGYRQVIDAVKTGKAGTLYVINGILDYALPQELIDAAGKVKFLVVQDTHSSALTEKAHLVLPSCTYAEKNGAFTNEQGMEQKFNRLIDPAGAAEPDNIILNQL
ncbi:MAG: (2Fe-2S)-binding protein [Planctomycetes bacterium]|nr:(2Fe-2S)-binding protein [Planctomycetota bacterium]